jgi:site-specific DNA-methyltransferase (adenine-specific)
VQGRRKSTRTSSFGSPGREGHDSSSFYGSRLYEGIREESKGIEHKENELPSSCVNKIFCKSSERMEELPDSSVHLMVTSPPYNVGKEYDKDLSLAEYRDFLSRVWKETYRVLAPGGRACINVANLGRKPYIPLNSLVAQDMERAGFLMRGEIIWNKASSASPSTAWGSWMSPANPTLRDVHEYILVFSKESYSRMNSNHGSATMERDEFLELTKSIWTFSAESAHRVGHPAPFPVELPSRCIRLFTFSNDIVLDPFMGSGSTALASIANGRRYVGYDNNPGYVELAEKRIGKALLERVSIP